MMEHETHDLEIEALRQEIQRLRRQTDFYEAALDAMPNPVFIRDEEQNFLFLNRSYREFFGLQYGEPSGMAGRELPHLSPMEQEEYEVRLPDAQGRIRETLYWAKNFKVKATEKSGTVGEIVEITEEKRLQRELTRYISFQKSLMDETKQASQMDSVTGLLNRHAFAEELPALCKISQQAEKPLCLLMTDIDNFKSINDTFGHLTGDEILKSFGETMKECFRSGDRLVRYGGDEFVAILPGIGLDIAVKRAEHFLDTVRKQVLLPDGKSVTISIGVAQLREGEEQMAFLSRADEALYKAKNSGKNRVESD